MITFAQLSRAHFLTQTRPGPHASPPASSHDSAQFLPERAQILTLRALSHCYRPTKRLLNLKQEE